MKIILEEYRANWVNDFLKEKEIVASILIDFNPTIEHIGSTSIVGLCAKSTIDILVGLQDEIQLDKTIYPMIDKGYTYFRKHEPSMPYRRLFSKLKALTDKAAPEVIDINDEFIGGKEFLPLTNIHIVVKDTPHWKRHIAFRDFLRVHANIRDEYGRLKKELSKLEFKDVPEYNAAKDSFIKKTEIQALDWYNAQKKDDESS
jgi:GrpB-like predicted nucleotidyltransferase (UPF0157 family)